MSPELETFERFCAELVLESGRRLRLEPYQRLMLADYFAGTRETLILLSKKNGKTTLLAALALYHLIVTQDAECVIGAASRDQATILFDQACGFVRRTPGLEDRVAPKRGYRELRSQRDAGRIRVLAADVDTADGVIPTLALVDELGRHRKPDLYGIFRDGLGPRRGQMLGISAAGDNEQSALGQMRAAARQLPTTRDGRYSCARAPGGTFVMHEWALDPDDDPDDLELVKQVNPASWQTIELLRERHDSPSMLPWQWQRFACGIWIGAEAWWIAGDEWRACWHDGELVDGETITLGFDGSRTGDATALVACRASDGLLVPLEVWEQPVGAKHWEVPGPHVDAAVADAFERFRVARAYFDPPLWHSEIDGWAREFGPAVMKYPTNASRMMAAADRFRTDASSGALRHNGNPILTRHVLNVQTRTARGGYWITKDNPTSSNKIDAAVAAVLAYEARSDALAAGELTPRTRRVMSF